MISFKDIISIACPDGDVIRIANKNEIRWFEECTYVSLGDSIAAGHTINEDWEKDYGEKSQFGKKPGSYTVIVPESYTDLIEKDVKSRYGEGAVSRSCARSGDTVADLIRKLSNDGVISAIKNAKVVTICIGANDVLQPALSNLESYINAGVPALDTIAKEVQANLDVLTNDANANSYIALFNKLKGINPNATYVFTTIYNPLKYLWIDESTHANDYKDGFFGPLMWSIPETIGDISNAIRKMLYNTSIVQTVFDRINGVSRDGSDGLSSWTENYINKLNNIIKTKITAYGNSHFIFADTKALFDSFPDRPIIANIHYNDLVSVEFTRGYKVEDMDWGKFWENFSISDLTNSSEGVMTNVITNIVSNVIVPDIDPHPEAYGHYALMRSYEDSLGWKKLNRYTITYHANDGTNATVTQELVGIDGMLAYTALKTNMFNSTDGNRFIGWEDQYGNSYADGVVVGLGENLTLTAQWSNQYILRWRHTNHTNLYGQDQTGHIDSYALYVNGSKMPNFGKFSDGSEDFYSIPKGASVLVGVRCFTDYWADPQFPSTSATYGIYLNGSDTPKVSNTGGEWAIYSFTMDSDVDIDFRWIIEGIIGVSASSWEDCYINTFDASYLKLKNSYALSYNKGTYGSGSMATQQILKLENWATKTIPALNTFTNSTEGYYYVNWKDQYGNVYANNGKPVTLNSDTTLTAQWSNMYTVAWKKATTDSDCKGLILQSTQTGPVLDDKGSERYLRVTLNDNVIPNLNDAFDTSWGTPVRSTQVPYGTKLYVQLINTGSYDRGYVKLNGEKQGASSEYTYFTHYIKHDTAMIFYWEHEVGSWTDLFEVQDYWIAEINEFPK